jgi:superfamily II DNA or RNA helicase
MNNPESLDLNPFVCRFDLNIARRHVDTVREPRAHQVEALRRLKKWFDRPAQPGVGNGALLVLPTGGGKTFTAVRFLCEWPLSEGYKVLWLAHTHHLLEQAFETFGPATPLPDQHVEVSKIRETRDSLRVRVVSGMPGHARVHTISPEDDVVIGSLQSIAGAYQDDHKSLLAFLKSAGEKLFVVFDEAHHAPAPTYARFVDALRQSIPALCVLGLTATPIYENKLRKGWLRKLFPQEILYQTTARSLMADRVLAEPVIEEHETHVKAEMDDRLFARWSSTYSDLPANIVQSLADNVKRNDFIIQTYVAHRARYGKTLIFADSWYQCDYICTGLLKHKVNADVVYSHVDAKLGTVDQRNRRTADDNTKAIRAFKLGELDVLVNVRMLTEGTDVPSVQSVFLTRQTTSKVLLTQMIGRALRGPSIKGTEKAYVVSFIDEWKQLVNWAEFSLDDGPAGEGPNESRAHLPVHLVSIELLRRLAEQMYQPASKRPGTFMQMVPVGWYRVQVQTQVDTSGDIERVDRLVLVYNSEDMGFQKLLALLVKQDLTAFIDPQAVFEVLHEQLDPWVTACFPDPSAHMGGNLLLDVFHIVRHMAQSMGELPQFFPFQERSSHDLDALAQDVFDRNVGRRDIPLIVQTEFDRMDRFWRVLYGSVDNFRDQFELISRRIENEVVRKGQPSAPASGPIGSSDERYTNREPSEETKLAVKTRDGWKCLCCGADDRKYLEVDHVVSSYHAGTNELENLQTLCKRCNSDKGVNSRIRSRSYAMRRSGFTDASIGSIEGAG